MAEWADQANGSGWMRKLGEAIRLKHWVQPLDMTCREWQQIDDSQTDWISSVKYMVLSRNYLPEHIKPGCNWQCCHYLFFLYVFNVSMLPCWIYIIMFCEVDICIVLCTKSTRLFIFLPWWRPKEVETSYTKCAWLNRGFKYISCTGGWLHFLYESWWLIELTLHVVVEIRCLHGLRKEIGILIYRHMACQCDRSTWACTRWVSQKGRAVEMETWWMNDRHPRLPGECCCKPLGVVTDQREMLFPVQECWLLPSVSKEPPRV